MIPDDPAERRATTRAIEPSSPPTPEEGARPAAPGHGRRLVPLEFADLLGFSDDDHAEAFEVFRRSAAAIVAGRPPLRGVKPPDPALVSLCGLALAADICGRRDAQRFFETRFRPWRIGMPASPGESRGFLTGYYEPFVEGSPTPTEAFAAPVLGPPDGPGPRSPLPERAEIEALARDGRLRPILWLRDPIEVFCAQVQGSARVRLPDGRRLRLVYAGRNGHPYVSIGRLLIESGEIAASDLSLARVKAWVRDHGQQPGEAGALLMQHNKSYVFFRLEPEGEATEGPLGGQGVGLTPLRSIAIDRNIHSYGVPFWIAADLPWQGSRATPFRRLMIAQDTGSAILGPARADIFFGTGDDAGARAGDIRHEAEVVVLLPATEGRGR